MAQREGDRGRTRGEEERQGARPGEGRGSGALGDTCGGPEEGGACKEKGGEQKEKARETEIGRAGGEAKEG